MHPLKDTVGWGFLLWLIGYLLGFVFFFLVPPHLIGWAITPIGLVITIWVLVSRITATELRHYVIVALVWTAIAIAFDYVFIVLLLAPEDGYYKPAVYLYYGLTLCLPLAAWWWKARRGQAG